MEQQAKDEGCKTYLVGETPLPDHYGIRDGILYTKDRTKTGEEYRWLILFPKTLQEPVLYEGQSTNASLAGDGTSSYPVMQNMSSVSSGIPEKEQSSP